MSYTIGAPLRQSPRRTRACQRSPRALFWPVVVISALTFVPSGAASAEELPPPQSALPLESVPVEDERDDLIWVNEITVSPLEAFPGDSVHVTGTCAVADFAATEVRLFIRHWDDSIRTIGVSVPIDQDTGLIDADVVVPVEAQPGQSTLGWMCTVDDIAFGGHDEPIPFMVLGSPTTQLPATPPAGSTESGGSSQPSVTQGAGPADSADALAATGAPDGTAASFVVGLLAIGGAATVVLARNRARGSRMQDAGRTD